MFIRNGTYEMIETSTDDSFEVDDLIAPTISLLNQKGYYTAFCCSGHVDRNHYLDIAYISFEFGGITPEVLPIGWQWVCDYQMEYRYIDITQEKIIIKMAELQVWAVNLLDALT